jgi:hypothetical protein
MAVKNVVRLADQTSATGFKNKIINGGFDIWQRGTTFTGSLAGGTYTADRYRGSGTGATAGSHTFSRFALGVTDLPLTEAGLTYYARLAYSVAPTESASYENRIENVRTFAGKVVTLSFYARLNSGSFPLAFTVSQNLGTGGTGTPTSVIPTIRNSSGTVVTEATSSWARYNATFTVPSLLGMTVGTTGNDYLSIGLVRPSSGTPSFDITGIQLEEGTYATPFEQRPIGLELSLCQRYFIRLVDPSGTGVSNGGTANGATRVTVNLPVEMRIVPTSLTASGTFNFWDGTTAPTGTLSLTSYFFPSKTSIEVEFNLSSAITAGKAVKMYTSNSTSKWLDVNAEL